MLVEVFELLEEPVCVLLAVVDLLGRDEPVFTGEGLEIGEVVPV